MKNEYRYILEWVAYHRRLAFDQIIVYSNDSNDGSLDLLDVLAQNRIVIHRRQSTHNQMSPQHAAYNDCIARSETEWIRFLDADEFLVLNADATVKEFVARFDETVSAIAINWRLFGSSGHLNYNNAPVIEKFTRGAVKDHSLNRHFKSIVRAGRVEFMAVHNAKLREGDYVHSNGAPIQFENAGRSQTVETEIAQVNHYCVKSKEEFDWKKLRGVADRVLDDPKRFTTRDSANFFDFHDRNEVEELALYEMRDWVRDEIETLLDILYNSGFLQFS